MRVDLLNHDKLSRQDYGPDDRFSYPIRYGGALLGHDGQGHINLLYCREPGKKADLVVLDLDPYLSDSCTLRAIKVNVTLSNGRLVCDGDQ